MKGIEQMTRNYLEDESYKVASAFDVRKGVDVAE